MNTGGANLDREMAKEQIRSRLDIVEVIGRYVSLKPAGRNMKARCPFHNERTPSFIVNPQRQIFHCFGCGKGGDVFTFLMEIEGLSFAEVMTRMAEETGVKLPARSRQAHVPAQAPEVPKDTMIKIHEMAVRFYYEQIKGNTQVIEYFKRRGLSASTVQEFRIGYAPAGWDSLTAHAAAQGVTPAALAACGLAIERPDGSVYDRFRDRIMFPIFDISGRPIAFGGRGLAADAEPKYLNSPETALYRKTRTMYGLHKARQHIKEKGFAILVEGYMDFLSLYQAGIRNCVATSGTALTEEHGRILRRFTPRLVLMFDGDEAGIHAAERAVFLLAPLGLDVRVLMLPPEHDPDTYVLKHGAQALCGLMETAAPGIQFVIDRAVKENGLDTPQGKSLVVNRMTALVAATSDPIVAAEYARQIAERTGVREQFVHDAVKKARRAAEEGRPGAAGTAAGGVDEFVNSLEGGIVALLVHHPDLIEVAMERVSQESFADAFFANLYSLIIETYRRDPSLATLMDRVDEGEAKRVLARILVKPLPVENAADELRHALRRLEVKRLKGRMRAISAGLKASRDESEKKKLLAEQQAIALRLREMDAR